MTTDNTAIKNTISIEQEMKQSYLDYAMSVIVSRALPDVRDGLKPVHRRILYAMKEGGYDWSKPFRKSARIVGDVMGKYHPHGDSAIYDSMVRMAQNFSLRLPLVDGQGNFGSMDGDPPAAMRYTEARLAKSAEPLLADIDKETVDFQPNYDESVSEPTVLPAEFPNLLVNGAGGIAVGMATNIPPHNLGEVIDATLAYIDNNDIEIEEMMEFMQGPDFPTGGIILGRGGIHAAFKTGRGSVRIRARTNFEEIRGREAIIVTEIPYQVNKSRLMERIAEVVKEKIVEGIADLRDESDRDGVRIVIELKKDSQSDVVLNQLFKFTPLQTSFGVNSLALNNGRPQMMNIKDVITAFVIFREEVITRRTSFELNKARARAHVLVGLAIAVANIDEMIALIRKAPDPNSARDALMARQWPTGDVAALLEKAEGKKPRSVDGKYQLTETQAKAILDLKLQRLTGLERERINDELNELITKITEFLNILGNRETLFAVMKNELISVKERFANPRRTEIEEGEFDQDIEDLIPREDMIVTLSMNGYIKRVPLSTYRAQKRGGKGRSGMATREEDVVDRIIATDTHTPLLFFTSKGIAHMLKVYKLPMGGPASRGKPMINLLPLEKDEVISAVMPMPENEDSWGDLSVMFATSHGNVRRNRLSDFTKIRANGKIAMKLEGDEALISVRPCDEEQTILLSTEQGKSIRFAVSDVRVFNSRTSTGVRGIKLAKGDHIVSMSILNHVDVTSEERDDYLRMANAERREGEEEVTTTLSAQRYEELSSQDEMILTVTTKGYGKRTSAYDYRITGRGGQGIANMDLTAKNGEVVMSFPVEDEDQIVLITSKGQMIRCPVKNIRITGRRTQGVTIFKVPEDDYVVSIARVEDSDDDENLEDIETAEIENDTSEQEPEKGQDE